MLAYRMVALSKQAVDHLPSVKILSVDVRDHLGATLRSLYGPLDVEGAPFLFARLIERLEQSLAVRGEALTVEVRDGLLTNLPSLRAFALSLTRNHPEADDLVQMTLLRAWQNRGKYSPGTNLGAWLFTIMRNNFYSERRKGRAEVEDPDEAYQARASVAPMQGQRLDVDDMWRVVGLLPAEQREALLLVAVEGISYDDAAAVMGCKVGTIKSRVFRARAQLNDVLGYATSDFGADDTTKAALGAVDRDFR